MKKIALAIALMTAATYPPRVLPVLLLSRQTLPRPLARWLSYVPAAVLAALIGPALFVPDGTLELGLAANPGLWLAIPVFAIAALTRNLFITVLTGMAGMALLRLIL